MFMKKILLLSLSAFWFLLSYAQQAPSIEFPATPKAAALAKYADTPVSYYSGVPNINIPLYTIEADNYKLPISLNYHASGIKLAQEASNVGLGWSLNAGGIITHQIRGFNDFNAPSYKTGYFYNEQYYTQDLNSVPIDEFFLFSVLDSGGESGGVFSTSGELKIDLEPDLFLFNFNGYSGKFIVRKTGLYEGKGILIEGSSNVDIKIIVNSDNISFKLTTPDGVIYDFSTTEKSKTSSWSTQSYGEIDVTPFRPISWYLDKITLTNNQSIDYRYEIEEKLAKSQIKERHVHRKLIGVNSSTGGCDTPHQIPNTHYYSKSESTVITLKEILWKNGKAMFKQSSRNDFDSKKISSINILDNANNYIKTVNLNYDYFNNQYLSNNSSLQKEYMRLKLTSVINLDHSTGESLPPHRFTYYEEKPFFSKTSNRYDYWGYQNFSLAITPTYYGNTPTRIPTTHTNFPFGTGDSDYHYIGANRKANFEYAKTGMLKSVQYPTSGIQQYDYELNKYFPGVSYVTNEYSHSALFYYGYNDPFVKHEGSVSNYYDFTINNVANGFNLSCYVGPGLIGYFETILALYSLNDDGTENEIIEEMSMGELQYHDWDPHNDDVQRVTKSFNNAQLSSGKYRLRFKSVNTNQHVELHGFINYTETTSQLNTASNAGGLRIKRISSPKNTREFEYTMFDETQQGNISSGILINKKLQSFYPYTTDLSCYFVPSEGGATIVGSNLSTFLEINSDTNYPLTGSITGNVVGYSKVTEEVISSNTYNNIKTIYEYYNDAEIPNGINGPNNFRVMNGKQKKVSEYWRNKLNSETEFKYNNYYLDFIQGFGYSNSGKNFAAEHIYIYETPILWNTLTEKKTTIHHRNQPSSASGPGVVTKEEYQYIDPSNSSLKHKLPVVKIISKSDEDKLIEKYYYSEDVNSLSNVSAYEVSSANQLTDRYQLNTLLQTELFLQDKDSGNNTLLNTTRISYKNVNNIILPDIFKTSKADNALEDKVQYLRYDSEGNILETLNLESGVYTSYIWSYNKSYPVAKVENASFIQLANALGKTAAELSNFNKLEIPLLEDLRLNLNKSMVTTYSYEELVGLKSVADPRGYTMNYHYDKFNRLEYVTDDEGNVVSKNEYYFKQQ